jgi:hypothetical protein
MGRGHEVEIQFPRDAVAALRQEYDRVHLAADDRMFEGSVRRRIFDIFHDHVAANLSSQPFLDDPQRLIR